MGLIKGDTRSLDYSSSQRLEALGVSCEGLSGFRGRAYRDTVYKFGLLAQVLESSL